MEKKIPKEFLKAVEVMARFIDNADKKEAEKANNNVKD